MEAIAGENPSYGKGGSGKDSTCDCIGLVIGAVRRCGGKWTGIHGSNWAARNAVSGLGPFRSAGELSPGDLVFKARAPGEKGYDLPDRYRAGSDRNDYYHVGVVLSASPLRIRHMTDPGPKTDTAIGRWSHRGRCRLIRQETPPETSGEQAELSAEKNARILAAAAGIERQLDEIYEVLGGRG